MNARYCDTTPEGPVLCRLCPHRCRIPAGGRGLCRVRENRDGRLEALTWGRVTSLALDPIEKKPLYHFFPGSSVLSFGGWGCNLRCGFCQNHGISQRETKTVALEPESAVQMARERGALGLAYTYNEPVIAAEYVLDCARLARGAGLKSVLVTNGFVEAEPLADLLEWIDAMNIDCKAFSDAFYRDLCGGSLAPVLRTIEMAAKRCHVEVTTLLIPGRNDAPAELDRLAAWIADHAGPRTPAHLSAYRPCFRFTDPATPADALLRARDHFRKHLRHVYLGNVSLDGAGDTLCDCGAVLVRRRGYKVDASGLTAKGACAACGAASDLRCS